MEKNDKLAEKLRHIVDQSPVIIAITDKDGLIEYVNKPFTDITGYSLSEVSGKTFSVLKSGFHDDEFYEKIRKTISAGGEWRGEIRNKKKNGELYWEYASIYALRDENGAVTNYVKIAEDATWRRDMQDMLNERIRELNSFYEMAEIIEAHDLLEDIFKYVAALIPSAMQYPGIACARIIYEGREYVSQKFNQTRWKLSEDLKLKNEKAGAVEVYYTEDTPKHNEDPFLNEEGRLLKGIAERLGRVAERKKMEYELQKTRDEFTAMLTHDLKSPLTAIMGFSEILADKDSGELPAEKIPYLNMMRQSGEMMLNIINNIVGSTRIESGKMVYNFESFPVEKLLEDLKNTFTPMSKMKEVEINFQSEKDISVYADREKIMQVLQNLVSNAFRYTPKGGKVKISAYAGNGFVNFVVSDTGSGIPKEEQGKLFQKFTQVKGEKRGTGLGLYIVKKILEGHGSTVRLESAPGEGTKFYFQLKSG